jgi:hypothetical protein
MFGVSVEVFWHVKVLKCTPIPSMHQKFTEHGKFCMQNYQLLTRPMVEFKDNCIKSKHIGISCIYVLYLHSL